MEINKDTRFHPVFENKEMLESIYTVEGVTVELNQKLAWTSLYSDVHPTPLGPLATEVDLFKKINLMVSGVERFWLPKVDILPPAEYRFTLYMHNSQMSYTEDCVAIVATVSDSLETILDIVKKLPTASSFVYVKDTRSVFCFDNKKPDLYFDFIKERIESAVKDKKSKKIGDIVNFLIDKLSVGKE